MTASPALGTFVLRTLLWLPPCLGAWHLGSHWVGAPGAVLARLVLDLVHPGLLEGVEPAGTELAFVTTVAARDASGQAGVLVATVDARLYTFGLALFAALMLAARARAWLVVAGAVLLVPFQAWSIAFDVLVQVGIKAGPAVAAQAGLAGWRREAIALGYQVGALLLPSLSPVVVWAAFNFDFITRLGARHSLPDGARA